MGRRAVVIVLDGLGAGNAPDAADFGDEGANTLANTARAVGGLEVPNLQGLVLEDPLPTYPNGFPEELLLRFEKETGRGVIGNRPASGTRIIDELGPEQEKTGAWILYTSADSVFQIAANTRVIPLDELYEASEKAHKMLIGEGEIMVERVIARPFHGEPGAYVRENENRHDYGITPPSETYLDRIKDAGHESVGVGKIRDIFDGRGITEHLPAPPDDSAKVDAILRALGRVESGLIFANLVDFDAKYGHRRDPEGMAENVKRFDDRLPELLDALTEDDLLIITADHGNDPTFKGTDHTRERVPLLVVGNDEPRDLGVREGFWDIGASVAAWLGAGPAGLRGESFLR